MSDDLPFKCPVCAETLVKQERSFVCLNRHTHDIARSGYVNLLLAQHKRSRQPGDSDEMVFSRQRFLNQGYYEALALKLAMSIQTFASDSDSKQKVLDLGCGEGYYLNYLRQQSLSTDPFPLQLAGIDISKKAVHESAKRRMDVQLAVASTNAVPFFDQQFDTLVSVFSPITVSEALRVIKPQGQLIMVGPGETHLEGLMSEIYTEVFEHKGNFHVFETGSGFVLDKQLEIRQMITVSGKDILDLLTMTPYYWHTSPENKAKLASLPKLITPIHFYLQIYRVAG